MNDGHEIEEPPAFRPFADAALAGFIRSLADEPTMSSVGDPRELRRQTSARASQRPPGPEMPTSDLMLPGNGLPMRLYEPVAARSGLVVFLHGGGWTIGNLDSHDRVCRRLAARGRCAVLAVDYRLAPEHPAPAAVDDAVAAIEWVASGPEELGGRPSAVGVAGDSAGGTVAALATLRLRHEQSHPDVLAMVYANTALDAEGGSMLANGHGFGLDLEDVHWFNSLWVPDRARWSDPAVSPLRVDDLGGLPETIIVTCALDPLRDQGEMFSRRLIDAGVLVTARREQGMVHNFLLWDLMSPACSRAADRVADDLAAALRRHAHAGRT